ncbi:hypothetical protein LPB73_09685 [Tardiphaga sp. 37S4]|uniref:hypothetical protein n=1 Tax=Tardiphaga sp. 37S4 TaxID=1404741 RepID=UPI001E55BEB1|nr:hypothetical protein [Tardiphaga sp. 37S4]UFS77622.1 hypothetical protein LPB73_09685 [Tardiphaga sp. 37S4]
MVNIPEAAIGAMVAALIAATVSLLGLIISKEQKTSEFRQAWIDALRSDLTAFLTQINTICDATKVKYSDHAEKVETLRPLYVLLNTSTFNILLRINPQEAHCKKLLTAMECFNALTSDESKLTAENIRSVEADFLLAAQALLKSEWRRVKSGEWTFRIAKLLALFVILASVIGGGIAAYRATKPTSANVNNHTPSKLAEPQNNNSLPIGEASGLTKSKGAQ